MPAITYQANDFITSNWADHDETKLLAIDGNELEVTSLEFGTEEQIQMLGSEAPNGAIPIAVVVTVRLRADSIAGVLTVRTKGGTEWTATQNINFTTTAATYTLNFNDLGQSTLLIGLSPGRAVWIDFLQAFFVYEENTDPPPDPSTPITQVGAYQDGPPLLLPSRRLILT